MSRSGAVRHHAIRVGDLEDARQFYAELGFTRVVYEGTPDPTYIRTLSGGAWCAVSLLKLSNEHGDVLECLLPAFAGGHVPSGGSDWCHFAVTVDKCDETIARLAESRGVIVGGPTRDPDAPFRVSYIRDPWGNLVEVVEAVPESEDA